MEIDYLRRVCEKEITDYYYLASVYNTVCLYIFSYCLLILLGFLLFLLFVSIILYLYLLITKGDIYGKIEIF